MANISRSTRRSAAASSRVEGGTHWRRLSTSSSRVCTASNQYRAELGIPSHKYIEGRPGRPETHDKWLFCGDRSLIYGRCKTTWRAPTSTDNQIATDSDGMNEGDKDVLGIDSASKPQRAPSRRRNGVDSDTLQRGATLMERRCHGRQAPSTKVVSSAYPPSSANLPAKLHKTAKVCGPSPGRLYWRPRHTLVSSSSSVRVLSFFVPIVLFYAFKLLHRP